VVFAESLDLALDERVVELVDRGQCVPVVLEVELLPDLFLFLEIRALLPLQQRVLAPGCAVHDRGRVRARCHRSQVAIVLLRVHVLGLVDLQQQ
jgi:hypothetical protein